MCLISQSASTAVAYQSLQQPLKAPPPGRRACLWQHSGRTFSILHCSHNQTVWRKQECTRDASVCRMNESVESECQRFLDMTLIEAKLKKKKKHQKEQNWNPAISSAFHFPGGTHRCHFLPCLTACFLVPPSISLTWVFITHGQVADDDACCQISLVRVPADTPWPNSLPVFDSLLPLIEVSSFLNHFFQNT